MLLGRMSVLSLLLSHAPSLGGPPASIVAAERAFAKLSETSGMRTAFMANLAEGSIVFRPGPVDGRKAYQDSPDVPGMLQWKPNFADISSSGDFGYTTGPWVFRDGQNVVHGHYVTVWKKQPDGAWKVVIDAGVPHPEPAESADRVDFPEPSGTAGAVDDETPKDSLLAADRNLSEAAGEDGFLAALMAKAVAKTRVYRPGSQPLIGPQTIRAALTGEPDSWVWEPSDGDAAMSGDLGYTYGVARAAAGSTNPRPGATNCYLRIWKRDAQGEWKVVLDLANPLPAS